MPNFPLHEYNKWDHHNGFHMRGDIYLTAEGQFRGELNTWTSSWGLGFTGGALAMIIDNGGNIIHQHLVWPLGVDARVVWWAPSSRTDHFSQQLDSGLVSKAERMELWLGHMPKDRWDNIIGEIRKKIDDLRGLYLSALGG